MKKKLIIGCSIAAVAAIAIGVGIFAANNRTPYNYDFSKYATFGDYKGLTYTRTTESVSDEEVEAEIQNRLQSAATKKTVEEGEVSDGDTINVSYEGKLNGKDTFEGGSSDSQDITIGVTSMIDGFTEGLVGHKVGDTVKLDLKFPDDYHEESVAGKDVVFTVKINNKQITEVPELNMDFVKKNSKAKSVDAYKEDVKKDLLESKQEAADQGTKQELWSQIVEKTKMKKYPEKEMKKANEKADEWENQYKSQASAYNMEWDEFMKNVLQTDEKGFKKIKKMYAEDIVKNEITLYYIADKENIDVSKREYKDFLDDILEKNDYTEKSFEEAFNMSIEEYGKQYDWEQGLLLDKVLDKVMKLGKETK